MAIGQRVDELGLVGGADHELGRDVFQLLVEDRRIPEEVAALGSQRCAIGEAFDRRQRPAATAFQSMGPTLSIGSSSRD